MDTDTGAPADNAICNALLARGVALPAQALDLSGVLARAEISRPYVIVMTGRCGSTWLAAALKQVPGAGYPLEYFSNEAIPYYGEYRTPQSFERYFEYVVRTCGGGGAFGFKSDPRRLMWIDELVDVARTFAPPAGRWIDMRRWDLVQQGFSFARARKSNLWHDEGGAPEPERAAHVAVGDAEVWASICNVLAAEQQAERFYRRAGILPLRIHYEEIVAAKRLVLMRVVQWIFGRSLSVVEVDAIGDGTRKFVATAESVREEEAFAIRHAGLLNDIYCNRAGFDVAALRQSHASLQ